MNRDIDLSEIRRDYDKSNLRKRDLPQNPIELFEHWFEKAKETEKDPTAMVLSTSLNGQPNSRVVLLKKVENGKLIFFTNYQSEKGQEMGANKKVALNFYWPDSERQVRLRGVVSKISESDSNEYFNSRPKESQIGAMLSQQSKEMTSRDDFEQRINAAIKEYADKPVPRPEYWGGYQVEPQEIEFWQGRVSRLHDRFLYKQSNGLWKISRLNP